MNQKRKKSGTFLVAIVQKKASKFVDGVNKNLTFFRSRFLVELL